MIANSIVLQVVATGGPPNARIASNPANIGILDSQLPTCVSELHFAAPTHKVVHYISITSTAIHFLLISLLLCRIGSISKAAEPIVFEEAVAPILRQNCVACHHTKKSEGGLNLENFASLIKGGDSGPTIDQADVEKSTLLKRISGDAETIMPPIDNTVGAKPLSENEQSIIKKWIQTGAMSKAMKILSTNEYRSLPEQIQTSYAIAVTPDGEWITFSRGNDLIFYPVLDWSNFALSASQQIVLKDVHRDSCFAIAASPDGQRVATGSSGEVKIWRRRVARLLQTENRLEKSSSASNNNTQPAAASESTTESKQLTFDGTAITQMATSKDGSEFATLDGLQRLRLWNTKNASLKEASAVDKIQSIYSLRLEKDVDRQKRLIDRWSTKLAELQAVAESATKAVEAAKQSHSAAIKDFETKKEELRLLRVGTSELEESIVQIQAAIEAGKQQLLQIADKQKLENADLVSLEVATKGTHALIELGNQKIAELNAKLETKKKATTELLPQEAAAKIKFDTSLLSLNQSKESSSLANTAVIQKQSQLSGAKKIIENLQSESALNKNANEELRVSSIAMAFTGNGKNLVAINRDYQLEVYANPSLQRMSKPIQLTSSLDTIQAVGEHELRLSGLETEVQRWSIETFWDLECTLDNSTSGIISDRVNSIAFNHNGTELAIGSGIGSRTGHLAILLLGTIQVNNLEPASVRSKFSEPELHSDTILGIAYSPDGRSLATCGADKMTKIIDIETMKQSRNLEGHTHHVLGVAWQEDGLYLSTASSDGTIKVWDSETGESTRTITIGKESTAISFVGNTTRVVSTVIDNTVRMHDIKSNDQIRQFGSAQNALYAVVVSPDGHYVVATGQEGIPRVWQVDDGKQVAEIK